MNTNFLPGLMLIQHDRRKDTLWPPTSPRCGALEYLLVGVSLPRLTWLFMHNPKVHTLAQGWALLL
jgi:hypothetical protein